mmetsp:Transcript_15997/g.37716  ORF Transcript_15997/g.37716 Transcript_15997/m.37716 type:complete len:630 (+) Transcript_15997:154-2043(+)
MPSKVLGSAVDGQWLLPGKSLREKSATKAAAVDAHAAEEAPAGSPAPARKDCRASATLSLRAGGASSTRSSLDRQKRRRIPNYIITEEDLEDGWVLLTAASSPQLDDVAAACSSPFETLTPQGFCEEAHLFDHLPEIQQSEHFEASMENLLLEVRQEVMKPIGGWMFTDDNGWVVCDADENHDGNTRMPSRAGRIISLFDVTAILSSVLRANTAEQPPAKVAASAEADADFVCVPDTAATVGRAFRQQRPFTVRALLWCWILILVLGVFSTTICWCLSLAAWDVLMFLAPVAMLIIIFLMAMRADQVCALLVAFMLAAAPAMPAYSAVHLMLSSQGHVAGMLSTWMVYGIRLTVLGTLHLVASILPVLQAEHPEPGYCVKAVMRVLMNLQFIADAAFTVGLWIYFGVLFYLCLACHLRILPTSAWEALTDSRELALMFHTLGILCQRLLQQTVKTFGEEFLPCLIGTRRARACTPQAITVRYAGVVQRTTPYLRTCVPPRIMVAFTISLRQLAPVVFPALALLPHLIDPGNGGLNFAVPLAFALLLCLTVLTEHHNRGLPEAALQQVPMLLPSGVPQRLRRMLGLALLAADFAEGTRTSMLNMMPPMPSFALIKSLARKVWSLRKVALA